MGMFENGDWSGIIALVIFFLFFLGVIAWVFRPGSKEIYRAFSNIPLADDDVAGDAGNAEEKGLGRKGQAL